jgi:hypothetical protein
MSRFPLLALAASIVCLSPAVTFAQESPWRISLSSGIVDYDLSDVGKTVGTAVRAERTITRHLSVEVGSLLARPREAFLTTTLLAPEALVRYTFGDSRIAPYLAGGGGFVMRRYLSQTDWEPSVAAAGGVRFRLTDETSIQGEMRLRGIGKTWAGSNAEWTAGLVWRP